MNAKIIKGIGLVLFVVLLSNKGATCADNDLKLRMGVEMEKELSKKLTVHLLPEIRLLSKHEIEEFFLETGLSYDVFKFLKVSGYYRAYFTESDVITNRFALDVKPSWKQKGLKIQYRIRFANYTDFDLETIDKSNYIRNRIKLEYKISKVGLNPYIASEIFYHGGNKEFNKIRYVTGLKVKLNKATDLSAYYMRQKKLTGKKDYANYLGLSFKVAID